VSLINANGIYAQAGNPIQVTDQIKAIIRVNGLLRRGGIDTFNFSKGVTGRVTELQHIKPNIPSTVDITGSVFLNGPGNYVYNFFINDKDTFTNGKFESDLSGVYIALKHTKTKKIVSRTQFERLSSPYYGGKATLKLVDEGEYEILIGAVAKPPPPKP